MRTFGTEKNYAVWDDQITETLLQERTTAARFPINPDEVMPRYMKAAMDQKSRTKKKAEVFTPVSIVKKMEDSIDKDYKGSLGDYIKKRVLEVTCGEAPFLTTRYDAATGEEISVQDRTGYLDRKLLCVPEVVGKEGFIECATEALKAVYGYEWQYDSLFLARRNLLMTTLEHYYDRFGEEPAYELVSLWATIISYNIFRMDGVSMCFPETDIPAKVMDWETGTFERFDGG
ncbi:MAG: hypothetical protein II659_10000 [Bacteroidales bacterium]|nr:hypothetical protein [Bacteroidales bacterium]